MRKNVARAGLHRPTAEAVREAARYLQNDCLVIFPTETLYGIAANPFSLRALRTLIKIKRRPETKGFIVLVRGVYDLRRLVKEISPPSKVLMRAFWPGPLTLVFKKRSGLLGALTGGRKTIAVRHTSHQIAQALMYAFKGPITAPSANMSGETPRESAREVWEAFKEAGYPIYTLNAGRASTRKPSTIVDVSGALPKVIREGVISKKRIFDALKKDYKTSRHKDLSLFS